MSRSLKRLLAVVAIGYLAIVGLMSTLETSLIFFPPELPPGWLADQARRSGAEELQLTAEDGTTLYAWWAPARGERAVVVFTGNAGTVGANPGLYERFTDAGLDVLHVNYRGYPGSTGTPSEEGLRMDARAAWAEARRRVSGPVSIYGKSLGGGVAVGLASEVDAAALVLDSTFESVLRVASEAYPWLPVRLVLKNRFRSDLLAPEVRCPTLLVHGTDDEVVPHVHGESLVQRFTAPARLLSLPGGMHNDDHLARPEVLAAVLAHLRGG